VHIIHPEDAPFAPWAEARNCSASRSRVRLRPSSRDCAVAAESAGQRSEASRRDRIRLQRLDVIVDEVV
jgi:hypothetical protein